MPFPKISRYNKECIVTEKIDGTSACICIGGDGGLLTGSRAGWITLYDDNFGFARWVCEHKEEISSLGPGRHFGEWWGSGIQRGYGLKNGAKRFSLFNTVRWGTIRPACCDVVPILWQGTFDDLNIHAIMDSLLKRRSSASIGFMRPEGIVIYYAAAHIGFKKTFEKDGLGKWYKKSLP